MRAPGSDYPCSLCQGVTRVLETPIPPSAIHQYHHHPFPGYTGHYAHPPVSQKSIIMCSCCLLLLMSPPGFAQLKSPGAISCLPRSGHACSPPPSYFSPSVITCSLACLRSTLGAGSGHDGSRFPRFQVAHIILPLHRALSTNIVVSCSHIGIFRCYLFTHRRPRQSIHGGQELGNSSVHQPPKRRFRLALLVMDDLPLEAESPS